MQVQYTPSSEGEKDSSAFSRASTSADINSALSALSDGELDTTACDVLLHSLQTSSDATQESPFAVWQRYQLIGDCLRAPSRGQTGSDPDAFVQRFRDRLAAEGLAYPAASPDSPQLAPAPGTTAVPVVQAQEAANASVFHWKMVAGVASVAAVAAIGWNSVGGLLGNAPATDMQLASSAEISAPAQSASIVRISSPATLAPAPATPDPGSIVIRDPQLDELLANQYNHTLALQPPAAFLRNASVMNGAQP